MLRHDLWQAGDCSGKVRPNGVRGAVTIPSDDGINDGFVAFNDRGELSFTGQIKGAQSCQLA